MRRVDYKNLTFYIVFWYKFVIQILYTILIYNEQKVTFAYFWAHLRPSTIFPAHKKKKIYKSQSQKSIKKGMWRTTVSAIVHFVLK